MFNAVFGGLEDSWTPQRVKKYTAIWHKRFMLLLKEQQKLKFSKLKAEEQKWVTQGYRHLIHT